jgi:Replication-relaxation
LSSACLRTAQELPHLWTAATPSGAVGTCRSVRRSTIRRRSWATLRSIWQQRDLALRHYFTPYVFMIHSVTASFLDHFAHSLSARDQLILEFVGKFRWALSGQIARMYFAADDGVRDRTCRAVLKRLSDSGWLYRLPRRLAGTYGGSGQYLYTLNLAGRRFTGHMAGERPRKPRLPNEDSPLIHALAITELAVRLQESKRAGPLGDVGYLPEFTGLPHLRSDALVGLLPPSRDLDGARRYFVEIELSRKDSTRLDQKLTAYTEAWRRSSWRRFPRVLFLAGSGSRFPSDARFIYREIEGAIRRQPADARHIFALTTYDEALEVLLGTTEPLILSADDDDPESDIVDPIQLVLPVDLKAPRTDEPPRGTNSAE